MLRFLWIIPVLFGMLLALTTPSESATLRTYTAAMLPASGEGYEYPVLTCGWHDQACTSGAIGNYLDWSRTTLTSVFFRGIFTRSGAPYETNQLEGFRLQVRSGPGTCDIADVAIIHKPTSSLLGYMRYAHMTVNNSTYFSIPTYSTGQYSVRTIGTMSYDLDGCAWAGYHVHAGYRTDKGVASRARNTALFPSGDYCPSGGSCYKKFKADGWSNWTHKFTWIGP